MNEKEYSLNLDDFLSILEEVETYSKNKTRISIVEDGFLFVSITFNFTKIDNDKIEFRSNYHINDISLFFDKIIDIKYIEKKDKEDYIVINYDGIGYVFIFIE